MNKILAVTAFFIFILLVYRPAALLAETSVKDVEMHLMCMCDDKCGKMLSNCNCKFAEEMRTTIFGKLKDGLTKDEILAFYIGKFGERVLAAPTKRGFNLIVWVTPFLLLFLGAIAIKRLINKWVRKSKDECLSVNKEKVLKKIDKKYMEQLKRELKMFDND